MSLVWTCVIPVMMEMPLTVVLGPDAPEPVVFAAKELGRYIEAASGGTVVEERHSALSNKGALLLLLSGQTVSSNLLFPESTHEEAYRIHTLPGGGRGFTGNSPRAVLYAVYDFLETELGYRWYFPYPEDNIQPHIDAADLALLLRRDHDRETEPAFSFREREFRDIAPTTDSTDERIAQQVDWWAKLRMNRFLLNFHYASNTELWKRWRKTILPEIRRRGMLVGLGEHGSYPLFLPPHRYAAHHPDWYCELDGERIGDMRSASGEWAQFCTTNREAVATYLANFADFVRAHPEVDFYYPAPNDIGLWCECARCRELSIADRYLRLNNQIAVAISEVKPGTRIMHLAYSNHRLPPEHTVPHPLIDVDVACWGRDFAYPLCDARTMPKNPDYLDVFLRWAEVSRSRPNGDKPRLLYHWKIMRHYWLGLHLLPLEIIDEDFRCIAEIGMDGFDLPLGFLGIWTKALNAYVVAQKNWNPNLSTTRLTERFMTDYYAAQAKDAARVYRLVADAFRDRRYGGSLTLAWFPDTSKVREAPPEGLGDNARHAVARLDEALALLDALPLVPEPVAPRLGKLHAVVRHARDEQRTLVALDALMHACHALRVRESAERRQAAVQTWEAAHAAVESLAAAYSLEEDEAGLYWGGASYRQLRDALGKWRLLVEEVQWQTIGHWETDDFKDSTEPISKRFDVTDRLADRLPGPVHVRFQYAGGELGASLRAVSLWQRIGNAPNTLLAEDRHSGFAGYVHENAAYHLDVQASPAPNARLLLEVKLAAYAAAGNVAQRGCRGNILIGLSQE